MRLPFSRVTYAQEHNIVFSPYAKYRRLFVGCQCRDGGIPFCKASVDEIAIKLRVSLVVVVHAVSNNPERERHVATR
jgi:hypothetical protein